MINKKNNNLDLYLVLKVGFWLAASLLIYKGLYDSFIVKKDLFTIVEVTNKEYEYLNLRYEVNDDTIYVERTKKNSLLSDVGQKFHGLVSAKDFSNIEIIYCMPYFNERDILDTTYAIVTNINRRGFHYDINDKWSFKVRSVFFEYEVDNNKYGRTQVLCNQDTTFYSLFDVLTIEYLKENPNICRIVKRSDNE